MSAPASSAAVSSSSDSLPPALSNSWSALISSSLACAVEQRGAFQSGWATRVAKRQLVQHFSGTIGKIVKHLQQQLQGLVATESPPSTDEILRSALTTVCPRLPVGENTLLGYFLPANGVTSKLQEASAESLQVTSLLFGSGSGSEMKPLEVEVSKHLAQWIDYVLSEIWETALDAARDNASLVVYSRFLQYLDSEVKAAVYGDSKARIDPWAEWDDYLKLNAWNAEKQAANAPATQAIIAAFAAAYAQATPNTLLPVGSVRLLRVHGPTAYPWFYQEYCPTAARMEEKQAPSADGEQDGAAKMEVEEEEEQSTVDAPFYFYDLELQDANNEKFQFRLQFAQSREESRSYSGGVLAFMPSEAQAAVEERNSEEEGNAPSPAIGGYFVLETEFKTFLFSFALPKQFQKPEGNEDDNDEEEEQQQAENVAVPQIQVLTENGVKQMYRGELEDPSGGKVATSLLNVLSVLLSISLPDPGLYQPGTS